MGMIFRFPFFAAGCLLWLIAGGAISFVQLITLPATMILVGLMPGRFGGKVGDILSLGTLRRGFGNLVTFLKYGG